MTCRYRDGAPLPCRTCHGRMRPREPSQQEVCQFHRSPACLALPGFDVHGKAPAKLSTRAAAAVARERAARVRSSADVIVGYHDPASAQDEDWGVKRCGCVVHVHVWDTCGLCSPGHYKTTPYSVQWRHYLDGERAAQRTLHPLVFDASYYRRISAILAEANKDVNRRVDEAVDYSACDSEVFRSACAYCASLPMPNDDAEPFKRCGACKAVKYCSAECQRAGTGKKRDSRYRELTLPVRPAWPEHKASCRTK